LKLSQVAQQNYQEVLAVM